MKPFTHAISEFVWEQKYRYKYQGEILDADMSVTWLRVARAISKAEKAGERSHWQHQYYNLLEDFKFIPGGRILAGAGTQHKVTLFNCFAMDVIEDSLSGIFRALYEGAVTLQQGGGVGYDFSTLRPSGSSVGSNGSVASGPVSFMKIFDAMCAAMQSTSARRGAMMGVLRCDHPDIELFIKAKQEKAILRHFNISVLITDGFMQAVRDNRDWPLLFPDVDRTAQREVIIRRWPGETKAVSCRIYKRVSARRLWKSIIEAAYEYAEPGVLFEDTINHLNNLYYREHITCTNPCGEVPLPPYGACNLGAINITQFVVNPFTNAATIDFTRIYDAAYLATRFLDNVIDVSRFPIMAARKNAKATRRIGLGITGLASSLLMLGVVYGSRDSTKIAAGIMQTIQRATWEASIELAQERGPFPAFVAKHYLQGNFVKALDEEFHPFILRHGIRNSHHNVIAPTGTTSLLANNISSGIEPIFEEIYTRKVRCEDGSLKTFTVEDYALHMWRDYLDRNVKKLPSAWIDASTLNWRSHLEMQAALQPYVDGAISKTIFIPEDFPLAKLQTVYEKAYELQLKGCTIFRPNKITGSVLSRPRSKGKGARCCVDE